MVNRFPDFSGCHEFSEPACYGCGGEGRIPIPAEVRNFHFTGEVFARRVVVVGESYETCHVCGGTGRWTDVQEAS